MNQLKVEENIGFCSFAPWRCCSAG